MQRQRTYPPMPPHRDNDNDERNLTHTYRPYAPYDFPSPFTPPTTYPQVKHPEAVQSLVSILHNNGLYDSRREEHMLMRDMERERHQAELFWREVAERERREREAEAETEVEAETEEHKEKRETFRKDCEERLKKERGEVQVDKGSQKEESGQSVQKEEYKECVVCLQSLKESIMALECAHVFHES